MSPIVYNGSIAAGVVLASIGAGAQFGWPWGLMAAGSSMVVLSLVTLRMLVR